MTTKFKEQSTSSDLSPKPSGAPEAPVALQYVHVKAVMLYWKDSDSVRDRVMEAEKIESVFKSLGFDTELYPIPTHNSHIGVLDFMIEQATLLELKKREIRTPCLLIVHYSGDGVLSDDHHNIGRGYSESRKRRVVWRPHPEANQHIRWDEIQGTIGRFTHDLLLLIDCSYTTQSGGRPTKNMLDELPDHCQLLASLGGHPRAEVSMEASFTTVMAKFMRAHIQAYNRVVISELYNGLNSRMSHLDIYPVLLTGSSKRSIVLAKLKAPSAEEDDAIAGKENSVTTIPAVRLLPETDSPTRAGYPSYVSSRSLDDISSQRQSPDLDSIRRIVDVYKNLSRIPENPGRAPQLDLGRGRVHAMISRTSEQQMGYAYVFAQRLINESKSKPGLGHMREISPYELRSVLEEFAGRLHEEATTPSEFALSVQLHEQITNITTILNGGKFLYETLDTMTSTNDSSEGVLAEPPLVKPRDEVTNWVNATKKSTLSQEPQTDLVAPKEIQTPSPEDCFISKSKAYLWLLHELQMRTQIHYSYPNTSDTMRLKVLRLLRCHQSLRDMSPQKPTPVVHLEIFLFWQLEKYVESLQLSPSPDMWEHVLCLTGSEDDLQLTTVAAYIRQTWPLSGGHLEQMLFDSLRHRPALICSYTFPSSLHVSISGPSSIGYCRIQASGGQYMVSEFAEQITWLAAVLRHSPAQTTVTVLSPRITISPSASSNSHDRNEMPISVGAVLLFDVQENQGDTISTQGTCWTRLFTNPILVSGYPILRKSTPATGLETSLSIMASLVKAHQIVRLDNRIVMKGFNSLVVAMAVDGASILWHAFTSSNPEERISYFDPRIEVAVSNKEETPLLHSLEGFRHIIGWCSEVTDFCGHPQADLGISASGSISCPAYTAIDRIYVEGGLYVIGGVNARINQREQPVRFGETRDYSAVFEWVADQFVAFYDVTDHRGWLVDGASALLHLVRTSLQLEEVNPESTYDWVFEKDKLEEDWVNFSGRAASIRTLKSWKNRALPVYIKNQTFSNDRPVNTYSTFGDRVNKVLHSFELLIEHQTRVAAESGIRVSQTLDTRKGILGFDVLDIVKSRPQCFPRIERFSSGDNSWVSLLPAIGVLTIFGKGFGNLICPRRPDTVCAAWRSVPKGQDYLTSSVSTLALLRKERLQQLETELEPGELTRKLFWVSPGQPFDYCQCTKGKQVREQEHRDPVQYIVSKPWLRTHKSKETTSVDVSTLDTTGAVVFVNLSSLGRRVEARNLQASAASPVSSSSHRSLSASASQSTAAQSSSSTAPTETSAQVASPASDQGESNARGDQSISSRLKEKWKGKLRTFYRT